MSTPWGKRADMVIHETEPFNAEPPRAGHGDTMITPLESFYSRNHGPIPKIEPSDWRLRIDGLIKRPITLTLDQLKRDFPTTTLVATLQCAGNRRAGLIEVRDIPGEDPWGPGATSTAQWTGARLADVLRAAGVDDDAGHVAFLAPDVSELADPPQPYGSSITLAKALAHEVLLAWEMNGRPLPIAHGGPVRVVVPGYIGARSVKWVEQITVQAQPSDNYFQAVAYRVLPAEADPDQAGPGDGISLSSVALNAEITTPNHNSTIMAGPNISAATPSPAMTEPWPESTSRSTTARRGIKRSWTPPQARGHGNRGASPSTSRPGK